MSRRVLLSTLGASALLVSGVAGTPAASALAADGPTAPASVSFGSVPLLQTELREVVVTVPADSVAVTFGGEPTIEPVAADPMGDFAFFVDAETCSGQTVQPGSTCSVTVAFQPFEAGLRQAQLVVAATSPATTLTVALSGTGAEDATGTFYGIAPKRLIDTRTSGSKQPLAKGTTTTLTVGGFSGTPTSGVSAVVINLTAVTTTSQGYFTVYPADKTRPTASSINFPKGWTGANMVTVPVSADGKVKLYNYGGAAHAIVDVLGWYAKDDTVRAAKGMGTQFETTESGDPERMYDSRQDDLGAFLGGDSIQFTDTWESPEIADVVQSYVVNVTAVGATSQGVLTLWGSGAKPNVSTVNYAKGVIAPNMAIVPAGPGAEGETDQTGFILQNTGSGSVHVVVDLVGYYLSDQPTGLRFVPRATPKRLVDTRQPTSSTNVLSGAFGGAQTRTVDANPVTTIDSFFVVANTTGILPTRQTYLTVWSGDTEKPSASNLNVNPGLVRSASTYAPLSYNEINEDLSFRVYNNSGSMHVALDVAGTFDYYPSFSAVTAAAARADGAATKGAARPTLGVDASERSTDRR